jgi:hypothetical protein
VKANPAGPANRLANDSVSRAGGEGHGKPEPLAATGALEHLLAAGPAVGLVVE